MSGWLLRDYECEEGCRFEAMTRRTGAYSEQIVTCECGAPCRAVISPVSGRVRRAEVTTTGRSTWKRPPNCLNTETLADGQSTNEWRQERRKESIDRRRKQIRDNI